RSMLGGGMVQYWGTTSDDAGMSIQDPAYGHHNHHPGQCTQTFTQFDRVGKPFVNELFAPVNLTIPTSEPNTPTLTLHRILTNAVSTPVDDVTNAQLAT